MEYSALACLLGATDLRKEITVHRPHLDAANLTN